MLLFRVCFAHKICTKIYLSTTIIIHIIIIIIIIIIAINKQLGNVVDTAPTEEMFEEEVVIETTLENKDGGWEGSSSW